MSNLNKWTTIANKVLKGKTIKQVRYMMDAELEDLMWDERGLVIIFTDDSYIYIMRDDEGNGPGSVATSDESHPVLPTL